MSARARDPEREGPEDGERAVRALAERVLGRRVRAMEAIVPGLGARRFYRLHLEPGRGGPATAVARVEAPEDPALRPPGVSPEPPLEPLRSFLEKHGLPVPSLLGADPERGILLLEDVGPVSLERAAHDADAPRRRALYARACALVPRLQRLRASPQEIPAFGRRLDAGLLRYKAAQVVEWALPWGLGRAASPAERRVVEEAFALVAAEVEAAPARLAHRDFKAQNLHLVAGDRLVMLDVQGAFLAPPEYDLVALLRDAHVPLPEAEVAEHLEAVWPQLPDSLPEQEDGPATFERRFTLLTLARNGKNLGRFVYAVRERGDRRYAPLVPREVAHLHAAARRAAAWDPVLARLAELLAGLPEDPACAP